MTIIEKIKAKRNEIISDPDKAKILKQKAIAAIQGGVQSPSWADFMNEFADTPEQLALLIGSDGTLSDPEMMEARANIILWANDPDASDDVLDKIQSALGDR